MIRGDYCRFISCLVDLTVYVFWLLLSRIVVLGLGLDLESQVLINIIVLYSSLVNG